MIRRLRSAFISARSHAHALTVAAAVLAAAIVGGAPPASAQALSTRIISTVAGTGAQGFSGDGGPATEALINYAYAAALDSQGNLYISDTNNNRIRRVDRLTGIITTVAGSGVYGSAGDGGPATQAELGAIYAMAFDASDNLYLGDGVGYTVRRIAAGTGVISRVAGNGTHGYSGDGGQATAAEIGMPWGLAVDDAGNLYIAAGETYRVRKVNLSTGFITTVAGNGSSSYGGDGGAATAGGLGYPYDVAVDEAGDLYIAVDQQFVRRVDALSGIITTVAGSGTYGDTGDGGPATAAGFKALMGVSLDARGHLFIADSQAYRVRVVSLGDGVITTVAGTGVYGYGDGAGDGGPASLAPLSSPFKVFADRAGNLVFGDASRVRHVSSEVVPRFTIEGDDASVLAEDAASFTVAFTGIPQPSVVWQVSTDAGQTFADLTEAPPYSGVTTPVLAISAAPFAFNGYLYRARLTNTWGEAFSEPVTLTVTKRVPVITWSNPAPVAPGTALGATQLNASASVPGTFAYDPPAGTVMSAGPEQALKATFTPDDTSRYIVAGQYVFLDVVGPNSEGARMAITIAGNGVWGYGGDGGPATQASVRYPGIPAVDAMGNLYLPDNGNHRIRKVDRATGVVTTIAGTGVGGFNGDGLAATATQFSAPIALAFDQFGNLYVSDSGNSRVRRIDAATGLVSTVAGVGTAGYGGDNGPATQAQLRAPYGLALDGAGNLFLSDSDNAAIRKVTPAGIITTIAGGAGYAWRDPGDGYPATEAILGYVSAVKVGPDGDLYLAPYSQNRIRKISAATGIITTIAGNGTYAFGGDGGPASLATLNTPVGLDFDAAGNLFIGDMGNNRIRKIAAVSGTMHTIAGSGAYDFTGDGGPAIAAAFRAPGHLAIDGDGAIFVGDLQNHRIRMIGTGAAPQITQQPGNMGTDVGGTVVSTAGVSGFPPATLKWQVSSDGTTWTDLTNGAPYSGVTTASLTIAGATTDLNGRRYHLVATNSIGTATSNAATLTVATLVKETPVITWANPAGIVYGTALGATQLNATANVSGTFVYTPATGAVLQAGTRTLSVLFTPDDGAHYTTATAEATLIVLQATPVITWADPASIVYGTALTALQLNATASVPGTFVYKPSAGTILNSGTQPLAALFTPTDSANYTSASAGASIVVTRATPVVTWATPASIIFGTPLGAAQLNATANVPGSFLYSQAPGTVLPAGLHSLVADFTPSDPVNYTTASANVMLAVSQATPTITWPSPAPIVHLTPLGPAQLNATANVPGTMAYWPADGAVLGIGAAQELRAYFTPADAVNWAYTTATTTIDVTPFGPVITTIAGNYPDPAGYSGDGGPATAARFHGPRGVSADPAGNLYVVDELNYRVRKIAAGTSIVSTVAGSGDVHPADGGFAGDGGPATAARFGSMSHVVADGAGNLYISDAQNWRVRKVTAGSGVVTTIAGTGVQGYSGDGGPATSARIAWVNALALDGAGNLYLAETSNNSIRKVAAGTGIITRVAGTTLPGFSGDGGPATAARMFEPAAVAFDIAGNLYIADAGNHRVRKMAAGTGVISTLAGDGIGDFAGDGGPATAARLNYPNGVAVDAAGNVFIADARNYRIRKIDAATGIISTVAGDGDYHGGIAGDGEEAVMARLGSVMGIGLDAAGNLLIPGWDSNTVRRVSGLGAPTYWLTIAPAPVHGVVAGGGISCGTAGTTCQAGFATATTVTLTATPDADYLFQGWGGACSGTDPSTTVAVGSSTACTAAFVPAAPPDGPPYTLTITPPTGGSIQGAGINCGAGGAACSVTMPASMTLGIGATASAGYTFTAWTEDCTGNAPTQWVALNGPRTCGATFTATGGGGGLPNGPPYALTITPPTGGRVSGAGVNCGAGGTACSVTMPAAMTLGIGAVASAGYTFAGWTGDCTGTNADLWVALNGPRACGATFTPVGGGGGSFALAISPAPTGGTVTGNGLACGAGATDCSVMLAGGTVASLTASPASGYVFSSWGGACGGTSATTTVLVDAARTCSATFTASGGGPVNGPPYTLTVTPPSGGAIQGAGINCGAGGSACSVTMPAAMTLGISATPSAGYVFTAWTGDCTGTSPSQWIALNGPRACGATFTATGGGGGGGGGLPSGPPYTLTITTPTGGKISGAGIDCGAGGTACSVTMPASMTLGISATASAGYVFGGWTGDCSGTNPSLWVSLGGARTCGATFTPSGGGGH